jgi:hypothetical protein
LLKEKSKLVAAALNEQISMLDVINSIFVSFTSKYATKEEYKQ